MIKVQLYTEEYKSIWNNFIKIAKNGSFLFDREFMEYHSNRFTDYSLIITDHDIVIAVVPANIKNETVYSHQGLTYGGFIVTSDIKMPKLLEAFMLTLYFIK